MSKYLLAYQGVVDGPAPEMTDEGMAAWGAWMGRVGSALVEGGAPLGARGSVGGSGTPLPINGFSIVEAADLDAAKALCDGHPYLDGAPDSFSVDVFELVPVEM